LCGSLFTELALSAQSWLSISRKAEARDEVLLVPILSATF